MSELTLPERLVLPEAAALREQLLLALRSASGELALDGSRVMEIDAAGLQTLLAAQRSAHRDGRSLRLARCSPALEQALRTAGAHARLGAVESSDG